MKSRIQLRSIVCLAYAVSCGALSVQAAPTETPLLSPEYLAILRAGDAQRLRETLDQGASVHARDPLSNTPLMQASVYGDAACVRLLLERGADVNATNSAGATALMRAAFDAEKVQLLLKHGAVVNVRSGLGNTALMLAARPWNSDRGVKLLLSHGADAKLTNNWGATALMAAAAGGNAESVRLLLKHGADVNASPVPDPVSFILGGARTPLMWAAYCGNLPIMKLLIDAGAQVNQEAFFGTPLTQASWASHTEAAQLLIARGANVNQAGHYDGFTPLHWAASTEEQDDALVKLLLARGANPNCGGGEHIDAFMEVQQTPLMLARRRGDTAVLRSLLAGGATNETPDNVRIVTAPDRRLPDPIDSATLQAAVSHALHPLQETSLESKKAFVSHASHQDCTSCHQQYLPMAAIGLAKKQHIAVDTKAERELIQMVVAGELKNGEADWQPLFHPDPAQTKGYALFACAAEDVPADPTTDAWVHHLAAIQSKDGRWLNNLPRPPLQSGDIGATALAIHALQRYPLPGRKADFAKQVDRARRWLWTAKSSNIDGHAYQLLGLAWAGETPAKLRPLANALLAEQKLDGGWAQLPGAKSDAYATGQTVYALRISAGLANSDPAIERARHYLLTTQLEDGTWYVRRRTFPFQPTMKSGFPHGRDSWISAAGTSWAVLALSLPEKIEILAKNQ